MDADEKYRLSQRIRVLTVVVIVLCIVAAALGYYVWTYKSQLDSVTAQLNEKTEYADQLKQFSIEQYKSGYKEGYEKARNNASASTSTSSSLYDYLEK